MAGDSSVDSTLVLVAVALFMQAGAMAVIAVYIYKTSQQVADLRKDVKERIDPLTHSLAEILTNSREPIRTITNNLADITRMMRDRTSHVDGVVAEAVDKSRLQVIRVDQMVSDVLLKIEKTTDEIQQKVLAPVNEISAVIKGVRSGLEFLFSRRHVSSVTEATQDEQLFI